ncbi:MAG: endopeptidase La [Deltaproteobacteria bacterium]|nr:endopeptidase La [Deltaproteobacteria bacterium]
MSNNDAEVKDPDVITVSEPLEKRGQKIVVSQGEIPDVLFVVVLENNILFPAMVLPIIPTDEKARAALESANSQNKFVALLLRKDETKDKYEPGNIYNVGTAARILKIINLPDNNISVVVQCVSRIKVERFIKIEPVPIVKIIPLIDTFETTDELEALWKALQSKIQEFIKLHPSIPDELGMIALNIEGPSRLADFVAANLNIPVEHKQAILETTDVKERLKIVLEHITKELEILKLSQKIQEEIRQKIEKHQRDFFLREQLKLIRRELGEEKDEKSLNIENYREKISKKGLPSIARERVEEELKRLSLLPPDAAEFNVIKTYLDIVLDLPWDEHTEDNEDIKFARKVLDEDHYGLEDVKERVLEFLAIKKLNPKRKGSILCFAGPPGVGKTSIGRSIAKAMGREFYRFSLGGMRDEAEIKGHRRTYIGAMPGKIIQALRQVKVNNPVIMLDEIDKLGHDFRGDPSSALLEVLDPEQNSSFLDHYLDIPFDLSKVFFIATANYKQDIPAPLLDRMEIIDFRSYILEEKLNIAKRYLIPKQKKENGLADYKIVVTDNAIRKIIKDYTRESGVRNLEREISSVFRKIGTLIVEKKRYPTTIYDKNITEFLGTEKFRDENIIRTRKAGVAVGLAWTPFGGDVMVIETTRLKGKGTLKLTGKLGDVISESAQIALSYIRANHQLFKIPSEVFEKFDIHIHFPAGAVPKDGPSAGVTITSALISLLFDGKGKRLPDKIAMTGEITLTGDVLPVGGIREKLVAARSNGIKVVYIPRSNLKDTKDVPQEVLQDIKITPVRHYKEIFKEIFG